MKFIKEPINQFIRLETSSSIILFTATITALILANSSISEAFISFWQKDISIVFPGLNLTKPILKWINDGLMAIFFFLIGLEIKREILTGQLSRFKKASLPLFAAIGGMVVPALLFTYLNSGNQGMEGWGIPMAADIAFTLGILKLIGNRVPSGIKIFLMAFAIIDDLGAVLVIAFFYSSNLIWSNILIALAIVAALILLSKSGFYSKYFFFVGGLVVWILILKSGMHATIAGVLLALTIPLKRRINTRVFYDEGTEILKEFLADCDNQEEKTILTKGQLHEIDELEDLTERTAPPLQYLEHQLHGWVSYLIMPLFALANAGMIFDFTGDTNLALSLNLGISMVVGNFAGIFLFSWTSIKLGISELPENVNLRQLAGVSILGGLGFTMSLFINSLAFTDPILINSAKIGIFSGSLIAGILGYITIRATSTIKPEA